MSIYPRRKIQELIDKNSFLWDQAIIKKLNDKTTRITSEWEVVILDAFAQLGRVEYEKSFEGTKPDIYFSTSEAELIADITTLSDKGAEKENPHEFFVEEFYKLAKKKDAPIDGFHISFGGDIQGGKMKLHLPSKGEIPKFVKDHFSEYLTEIAKFPLEKREKDVYVGEAKIKILYNPEKKPYNFSDFPSYEVPYSKEKNVACNILKKKARQLENTKFNGIKGIILCDGGNQILQECFSNNITHYNFADIVQNFFEKHGSISFVIVVSPHISMNWRENITKVDCFFNPKAKYPVADNMKLKLESLVFPLPVYSSINALHNIDSQMEGKGSIFGEFIVTKTTIEISCRLFLDFLSGVISWEDFRRDTNVNGINSPNMFSIFSQNEKVITNIHFEKCDILDDDRIVFVFSKTNKPKIPQNPVNVSDNKIEISSTLLLELLAGKIQSFSHEFKLLNEAFSFIRKKGRRIEEVILKKENDLIEIKINGFDPAISDYRGNAS